MGNRPISRIALTALAAAAVFPSLAVAQTEPEQQRLRLEEKVTVTANRLEQAPGAIGSSITIISAEDIRSSGATWLSDVLGRAPGVSIARVGGPGGVTTAFLRGTNSNHTLVLINGLKANAPSTGAFNLASVPASRVERVEIIRGPQSALYGSEAMGGVINIITRSGVGAPRLELSVDGGSYGTAHTTADFQGQQGNVQYSVGIDYFNAGNFSSADAGNGNSEQDRFRNTALDARVGFHPAEGLDIEGFLTYFDGQSRIDGFDFVAGPIDDPDAVQDTRELYGGVALRLQRGSYGGQLTLSSSSQKLGTADPNGFQTAFDLATTVRELDWQNNLRINADNTATLGVEYRHETADSSAVSAFGISGFDEAIDVTGVYVQHRFSANDRLNLTAGARLEDHSRFGTQATYRLTAAYNLPQALRLHTSLASGFRAPTLNELFFPGFGNAELAPEETTGWDLGINGSWLDGRVSADLTWFSNDLDELIEFTFPAGFVNLGAATSQGFETAVSLLVDPTVRIDAAYTFTDATTDGNEEQLLRRARHQGSVAVRFAPAESASLFTELRFKGARNDFGTLGTVVVPGYVVWNAAARVRLSDDLQLTGRLDNITDKRYQEVWGFGTAGVSGYLGLRYSWSRP